MAQTPLEALRQLTRTIEQLPRALAVILAEEHQRRRLDQKMAQGAPAQKTEPEEQTSSPEQPKRAQPKKDQEERPYPGVLPDTPYLFGSLRRSWQDQARMQGMPKQSPTVRGGLYRIGKALPVVSSVLGQIEAWQKWGEKFAAGFSEIGAALERRKGPSRADELARLDRPEFARAGIAAQKRREALARGGLAGRLRSVSPTGKVPPPLPVRKAPLTPQPVRPRRASVPGGIGGRMAAVAPAPTPPSRQSHAGIGGRAALVRRAPRATQMVGKARPTQIARRPPRLTQAAPRGRKITQIPSAPPLPARPAPVVPPTIVLPRHSPVPPTILSSQQPERPPRRRLAPAPVRQEKVQAPNEDRMYSEYKELMNRRELHQQGAKIRYSPQDESRRSQLEQKLGLGRPVLGGGSAKSSGSTTVRAHQQEKTTIELNKKLEENTEQLKELNETMKHGGKQEEAVKEAKVSAQGGNAMAPSGAFQRAATKGMAQNDSLSWARGTGRVFGPKV